MILGKSFKIELTHNHNHTHILNSVYKDDTAQTPQNFTPFEEDPEVAQMYKEKVDPMAQVWAAVHNIMEGSEVDGRTNK
jgi:hypothetical protein